ncbi:MAG: ribonuclease J [Deltaproteobacteria bacterium]|nr:ribonuclease J [Deltaproteobacteria bacterium]
MSRHAFRTNGWPSGAEQGIVTSVRFAPLGGLGEIGMNCMSVECGDDVVIVDCGVMFPPTDVGVDVLLPDFAHLLANRDRVRALVLTHGHEDHIGAVPFLVKELRVPVHGPPYALGLVRERLAEHGLANDVKLVPTTPRTPFRAGRMEIEPIRVTHSIADATALVLRTDGGTLVHTGDFKIDDEPTDGAKFDAERLREIGREGVDLLWSDSTNSDLPGRAGSEASVARALSEVVENATGRVIVGVFSSNVHRLRAVLAAARRTGRLVACLGRSARTHLRVATELGHLPDASDILVPGDALSTIARSKLLVVASGTQAERGSALTRLAGGTHPALVLEPGDLVVLSARAIPGNERAIQGLVDGLERQGAIVRFPVTDPALHVSGHAGREEQRTMIELVRPRGFVPVHGYFHHLSRHAALARSMGVDDVLVIEDGALAECTRGRLSVVGKVPTGRIAIDEGQRVAASVLRDRALLGTTGIAIGVVVLRPDGALARDPTVITRGVLDERDEPQMLAGARRAIAAALDPRSRSDQLDRPDPIETRDTVRRALRRYFRKTGGPRGLTTMAIVLDSSDWD